MKAQKLFTPLEHAASRALKARERIERAVNEGRVPAWVLDACEHWEKAAMEYGAARARDPERLDVAAAFQSQALH